MKRRARASAMPYLLVAIGVTACGGPVGSFRTEEAPARPKLPPSAVHGELADAPARCVPLGVISIVSTQIDGFYSPTSVVREPPRELHEPAGELGANWVGDIRTRIRSSGEMVVRATAFYCPDVTTAEPPHAAGVVREP